MTDRLRAHLALFIVGCIYALNYIVAKDVMPDYIGPSGFIFWRVLGATCLFWLLGAFLPKERVERDDYPRFIACALFGVTLNQLLFFNGLNLTSPINASVIMTTNPVLVLLISAFVLRERITSWKVAGIALGIGGALCLILLPVLQGRGQGLLHTNPLGDLFILINALSYAVYLVSVKPLMRKYRPWTVIKWVFTFGVVLVFPFGYGQAMAVEWTAMPAKIIWEVAFVIAGVTFLAYLLNIYALKTVNASVVSVYIYMQPLLAGFLSIFLGMEQLHWVKILAAVMIFTGVYLVSLRRVKSV